MQTNLGYAVESRSIDDDDFCQLQLHQRQYFTDPQPRIVQESQKHLKIYQLKSVRAIGSCCWAFYRRRHFRGKPFL